MSNKNDKDSLSLRWEHRRESIFLVFLIVMISAVILIGWWQRTKGFISAESGFGYFLGISGAGMMLMLLTYSLSKSQLWMRKIMPIRRWFQLHMTLGVVGPLCVLFHCNYSLGSLNSTIALVCMLLVAGSGIIGRYFYTQIHYGIHGQKIKLQDVLIDSQRLHAQILPFFKLESQKKVCDSVFDDFISALRRAMVEKGLKQRKQQKAEFKMLRKRMTHMLRALHKNNADNESHSLHDIATDIKELDRITRSIMNSVIGLFYFEKLFSIWHVVHIPIFFLMLVTAIVHIVVVHMY